jgi:hypothetical protein
LDAVAVATDVNGPGKLAVYIRSQENFTVPIRDGDIQLYFCLGEDWDSGARRFTRRTSFFRFAEPLRFESTFDLDMESGRASTEYTTWEVTLHAVPGGTARTESIPEAEFPTLQ